MIPDSDPSDEIPLAEKVKTTTEHVPEQAPQPSAPGTPPAPSPQIPAAKKGGRPPNARKGKVGRNQYTRDGDDRSPHRSQSRDVTREESRAGEHKTTRIKASPNSKVSLHDMRRRVTGILDFISRTQIEMAGESNTSSPTPSALATSKLLQSLAAGMPDERAESGEHATQKDFKDMSCTEMMDVLTRRLVKWQQEFT